MTRPKATGDIIEAGRAALETDLAAHIAAGAGDESTVGANVVALDRLKLDARSTPVRALSMSRTMAVELSLAKSGRWILCTMLSRGDLVAELGSKRGEVFLNLGKCR